MSITVITSRLSGRGNGIGPVCVFALSGLNRLTYRREILHGHLQDQGQMVGTEWLILGTRFCRVQPNRPVKHEFKNIDYYQSTAFVCLCKQLLI